MENKDLKYKAALINEILFVAKCSNISHNKFIPLDTLWINLIFKTEAELINICRELYIKIPIK